MTRQFTRQPYRPGKKVVEAIGKCAKFVWEYSEAFVNPYILKVDGLPIASRGSDSAALRLHQYLLNHNADIDPNELNWAIQNGLFLGQR